MNATTNDNWLRASLAVIVIVHCVVALWHGVAHLSIPVPLTGAQMAFVGVVIVALPLIGAGMLWTDRKTTAAWLIALSMLGSLIFGLANHFMLESPDYVMEVPAHAWRYTFVLSAALLAVTESIGAVLGGVAIRAWRSA